MALTLATTNHSGAPLHATLVSFDGANCSIHHPARLLRATPLIHSMELTVASIIQRVFARHSCYSFDDVDFNVLIFLSCVHFLWYTHFVIFSFLWCR